LSDDIFGLLPSWADIQRSPSVEKLEIFFKRALELEIFEQESLARSLNLYHNVNICVADLEAHPEAYPILEGEEEFKQCMEDHHRRNVVLAEMAKEAQERQRNYAENKAKLAAVNEMIAERRAKEQLEQSEPSVDYDSE
jgi:hypothetical protein